MNPRIRNLLQLYDNTLAQIGVTAIKVERFDEGALQQQGHARWMILQMLNPTEPGMAKTFEDELTVNRWLGFIQGVMWQQGFFDLPSLCEQTQGLYDSVTKPTRAEVTSDDVLMPLPPPAKIG